MQPTNFLTERTKKAKITFPYSLGFMKFFLFIHVGMHFFLMDTVYGFDIVYRWIIRFNMIYKWTRSIILALELNYFKIFLYGTRK